MTPLKLILLSPPKIIRNSTFDDSTGWLVLAGWVVSGGVATASATSTSLRYPFNNIQGANYQVDFDWTHTSGTLDVSIGLGSAATFTTSGHKSVTILCGATANRGLEFFGGTVTGVLDNVVVRRA